MSKDKKLRELQLCELEILRELVAFCDRNKIRYYISGGTFLGAVRHKGFIPWDDDVDIAMPREDYEKFLRLFEKENQKYKLSTFEDESETVHYQAKIIDETVKVVNTSGKENQIWSAWIDVFPLDGMPKFWLSSKLHQLHLLYLRARLKFTCFDQVNLKEKHRGVVERTLIWLGLHLPFLRGGSSLKYLQKIDGSLRRYPSRSSEVYVNFMGAYKFKSILEKDYYYSTGAYYDFEGMKLFGPKNYDAYLTRFYGDYMKPPKVSERNHHNTEVLDVA